MAYDQSELRILEAWNVIATSILMLCQQVNIQVAHDFPLPGCLLYSLDKR